MLDAPEDQGSALFVLMLEGKAFTNIHVNH